MPAISVRELQKSYGGNPVLRGLSFEVPEGKVGLYLGPNGSGKTTTFRLLAGLESPDGGDFTLLGSAPAPALRNHLGVTFEEPRFYPHLSGLDNLRVVAQMRRIADPKWPALSLERVGLAHAAGKKFKGYSQGMRQRLYLASCLLPELKLLLLDEPTNGLDVEGRQELWSLLTGLRDQGVSLLVSTHQILETERYAEHVVMLHGGRCRYSGSYEDLLGRRQLVAQVNDERAAMSALQGAGVTAKALTGSRGELALSLRQGEEARAKEVLAGTLLNLRAEDLEELYWRVKDEG